MTKLFVIGLGGALGALLRYSVTFISTKFLGTDYPWGTFIVNLVGAFIIGLMWGMFETSKVSEHLKSFVLIGIIGSFTTFSTLSLDGFNLLRTGHTKLALAHLAITNILGLLLVITGYLLAKRVAKLAYA